MNWYFSSCSYNDKSLQSNNCHQYLRIRNLHCKKIAEEGHGQNTLDDKHWGNKSLHVYWRIFVKIFEFATAFCCCNKSQNQICKNLSDLLRQQNYVAETKICTKDKKRFVAATCCVTCCSNLMPDLFTQSDLPPCHVAATRCLER